MSQQRIPVQRVIEKLDRLFDSRDLIGAGRLLDYWRKEAVSLQDFEGELSLVNEQLGYFRRTNESVKAEEAVTRALFLIDRLGTGDTVSAATVFLNAATTLKAFGKAADALPLYERCERIYIDRLPKDDALFGGFYNNYGLALADLCRLEEAEQVYRKALAIMLARPDGKPEAAITYLNLAYLYAAWIGRPTADVEQCLSSAEALLFDDTIPKNGHFAFVLSKCAPSFREFGKEAVAVAAEQLCEVCYERA